jgi:hypothetical protein
VIYFNRQVKEANVRVLYNDQRAMEAVEDGTGIITVLQSVSYWASWTFLHSEVLLGLPK